MTKRWDVKFSFISSDLRLFLGNVQLGGGRCVSLRWRRVTGPAAAWYWEVWERLLGCKPRGTLAVETHICLYLYGNVIMKNENALCEKDSPLLILNAPNFREQVVWKVRTIARAGRNQERKPVQLIVESERGAPRAAAADGFHAHTSASLKSRQAAFIQLSFKFPRGAACTLHSASVSVRPSLP